MEQAIYQNTKCSDCIYFDSAPLIKVLEVNYLQGFLTFMNFIQELSKKTMQLYLFT